MKLDNLRQGMEIKNYKELCQRLELKPTSGRGRENQLEWIGDYIKYRKKGHKFIIEDVFTDIEIIPMKGRGGDTSDNTHIEYIEKLILDLLVQDESGGEIFLSKTKMFETLDMVNSNFGSSTRMPKKVAGYIQADSNNVEEWFTSTGGMLERNLNKALNRLEKQFLIYWSKKITIHKPSNVALRDSECSTDIVQQPTEAITRGATREEVGIVIGIEREVMLSLGCENKQQLITRKKWGKFEKLVKGRLYEEEGIDFYWQSYHIIYNPAHVRVGAEELNKRLLPYEDRLAYKKLLNSAIQDNTHSNSLNRNKRATKELQDFNSRNKKKNERRSKQSYIVDSAQLSKTMISIQTPNVIDEIAKIKP